MGLRRLAALACAAALVCLLVSCAKSEAPSESAAPAAAVEQSSSAATEKAHPPPPQEVESQEHAAHPHQSASLPPFPWPPPPFSASMTIPRKVLLHDMHLRHGNTPVQLKDVDAVLHKSLRNAGYEVSYFSVERGFALVSRMERITDAGAPYPDARLRFNASLTPIDHFSIDEYLKALFFAPPGYFRLIVFIVTPVPFSATGKPVTSEEANAWLETGANLLPASVGRLRYSDDYVCTALIYEFEKRDVNLHPVERHPGRLSAATHLTMAGIHLGQPQPGAP